MSAFEFVGYVYRKVGRPFKDSKHLAPDSTQIHMGLQSMLWMFQQNSVSREQKPGKFEEIYATLNEMRKRYQQQAALSKGMVLAGKFVSSC